MAENGVYEDNWAPNGDFLPGHSIKSPGRPKGSVGFMTVFRAEAKRLNVTPEELVALVIRGLLKRSSAGDAAASKILLDRTCGLLEKSAEVHIEVDARTAVGPPIPPTRELGVYLRDLADTAAQLYKVKIEDVDPELEAFLSELGGD